MSNESTQGIKFERKYCPKCYGQFERTDTCPDDGTELRGQDNDPLIGKVFAERYQIESVLGCGGMSIVYKAKHRLMDRIVAIKMLHGNIKKDHVALERFRLEAQAASSLSHQNIITVYDFGVTPQSEAFFVMDFLDGENLAELLERKTRLPWERAVPIFKQICDGLGAAHKKGIIHRDLKPANVVLIQQDDGSELVKLVDFGIAKIMNVTGKEQQTLTKTGEVFGSPIYMSPEQCLSKELDQRSDIYGLGCLMYETLMGDPPHLGANFLETLNKHVDEAAKPFSVMAPTVIVPPELEEIVMRCMAKNPDDRFQNAEEIRDQLGALSVLVSKTGAQRAQPSGSMGSLKKTGAATTKTEVPCTAGKRIWSNVATTIAAVLIAGLAFTALWQGPPEDPGSPLNKLIWGMAIGRGSDEIQKGDYAGAEKSLDNAEGYAKQFGDRKTRLEATLKMKADLYSKWEGHAERLERTNVEIANIQGERILQEFKSQMATINMLDKIPADSTVARTDAQLKAEAQVPGILTTASKLSGRKMYQQETELLRRALAVEKKLLDENSSSLAKLESALADGYIGLRNYPEVRSLLMHALAIRKTHMDRAPSEYVQALSKLGQFDLDQSNLKDAESELSDALKLAKQKKVDSDLQVLCLRSYADLLHQTKREQESGKYLKEADAIERKSQG